MNGAWMTAADAARLLDVARATLYAYVSRGYVRSQPAPGRTRERLYARDDVEHLRQRTERRNAPDRAAAKALQWGLPVLESSITLIDGRHLYYRGEDAVRLALSAAIEEVAALIWTGDMTRKLSRPAVSRSNGAASRPPMPFIPRAQSLLAAAASRDPAAFDTRPDAVARTGWGIVWLLASAAAGRLRTDDRIETALCRAWKVDDDAAPILRAALVLCADHDLNVSAFTARCVASAGAHPYGVVIAGLAALEGPRHGGAGARVEAMLTALRRERSLDDAVRARLRRGEPIDGFGHPLYRDGDPRAAALLDMLDRTCRRTRDNLYVHQLARAVTAATGEEPNLDFALAAVAFALHLPPGAPLVVFAIGRTIGWIGHALEQYATGQLIRPRARYVGVVPRSAPRP